MNDVSSSQSDVANSLFYNIPKSVGSVKKKLLERPVDEWVSLIAASRRGNRNLIKCIKSTVERGEWELEKRTSYAAQFITQACAELEKKILDPKLARRFEMVKRVYKQAQVELLKGQDSTKVLTDRGESPNVDRPQFTVERFDQGKSLKSLKTTLKNWRLELQERSSLAETLHSLKLLSEKNKQIIFDANKLVKCNLCNLPKVPNAEQCVYVCKDEAGKMAGVAMRWYKGYLGYHLRFPLTAPKNIDILNTGRVPQRGAVTAIITKMAEDILQDGKKTHDGKVPRLYCEPVDSAVPFYKKLGFVEPKGKPCAQLTDSDSDTDSDCDYTSSDSSGSDSDSGIEILELDAAAMQALVKKQAEPASGGGSTK